MHRRYVALQTCDLDELLEQIVFALACEGRHGRSALAPGAGAVAVAAMLRVQVLTAPEIRLNRHGVPQQGECPRGGLRGCRTQARQRSDCNYPTANVPDAGHYSPLRRDGGGCRHPVAAVITAR